MSDHKGRLKRLEHQFAEQKGAHQLDAVFAAVAAGDVATLEMQERIETAAGGKAGWTANLLMSIRRGLGDGPMIESEDLMRPSA